MLGTLLVACVGSAQTRLEVRHPVEREMRAAGEDTYTVHLEAGEYAHVVVEKIGIDVVVSILGTDGGKLADIDSPNDDFGPESLSWIAGASGDYSVRAAASDDPSAVKPRYRIELTAIRTPSATDRQRIQAEAGFRSVANSHQDFSAIPQYRNLAETWRGLNDGYQEAWCYVEIAYIREAANQRRMALADARRALALFGAVKDLAAEGGLLNYIGTLYFGLLEYREAVPYYERALPLLRLAGDRYTEAAALTNAAQVYTKYGPVDKALDYLRDSLTLRLALHDSDGEAITRTTLGGLYRDQGDNRRAMEELTGALKAVRDPGRRAIALTELAFLHGQMANLDDALRCLREASAIYQASGDTDGEIATRHNIARVYYDLGAYREALENSREVLKQLGNDPRSATILSLIGLERSALADQKGALLSFDDGLARVLKDDPVTKSTLLNGKGIAYVRMGQIGKALACFQQAFALARGMDWRVMEGVVLLNIGAAYSRSGDSAQAMSYLERALVVEQAVGDRDGEARTLHQLGSLFSKQHSMEAAIWLDKQAVNTVQGMRRDNRSLPAKLKSDFQQSVESYYRDLAALLLEQKRFTEAEEVLDLLKDEEAAGFLQRDAVADQLQSATLLKPERESLTRYTQISSDLLRLGREREELRARSTGGEASPEEQRRAARIDSDIAAANATLLRFFDELRKRLDTGSRTAQGIEDLRDAAGLQSYLSHAGDDVAIIYTVETEDKYIALLLTGAVRKAYVSPIPEKELDALIFKFREALLNPSSDPKALAQELYRIVFPENLRQDLDAGGIQTLLWSVDNTLRYVPIAALHDGRDYLVKRFRNSIITPASRDRLAETSDETWRGIGFGAADGFAGYPPLPSVPGELQRIFRGSDSRPAPVPGVVHLNGEFTRAEFLNLGNVRAEDKRVVHIASHFDAAKGAERSSKLLLGTGGSIDLREIDAWPGLFRDVELLTLSACRTAYTNHGEDGREIDSFGIVAQRQGAKAVIASLWSVDDASTGYLMEAMYRIRQEQPSLGKSEALRRSQEQLASGAAGHREWTHPYYWAPFILIGNWR
jgi:CHAT domain-containing protein/Tfp pilus assembly protein PilF